MHVRLRLVYRCRICVLLMSSFTSWCVRQVIHLQAAASKLSQQHVTVMLAWLSPLLLLIWLLYMCDSSVLTQYVKATRVCIAYYISLAHYLQAAVLRTAHTASMQSYTCATNSMRSRYAHAILLR
jgi:hypothetical protein